MANKGAERSIRGIKKFFHEFKEFALKGNVMSLAVGVIIGGAFQGVVKSLTENILTPVITLIAGKDAATFTMEFFGIKYGAFITSLIDFLIMAFVVFLMVKAMNRIMDIGKKAPPPAKPPRLCPFCKSTIHDEATRCPHCTSELEA